jgi:hypothetical protein
MSIEQRIRAGLAENAAHIGAPVEAHLDRVRSRHRRRVTTKVVLAVTASVLLVGVPWVVVERLGDERDRPVVATPAEIAGTYRVEVPGGGPARQLRGTWEVTLRDGLIDATPPRDYEGLLPGDAEAYQLEGDELTTNLYLGWPGCQTVSPPVGRYRVDVTTGGVRFELVEDTCPARIRLLTSSWERLP